MKKLSFIFTLAIMFCSISFGQNKVSDVVGTYRYCIFPCEYLKINSDFTFQRLIHGDLFNMERATGKWKIVDGVIQLKTSDLPPEFNISESKEYNYEKTQILAINRDAMLVQDVKISIDNNFLCKTDKNGQCETPKIEKITVNYKNSKETYFIKDVNTSQITIFVEEIFYAAYDQELILKNKRLCFNDKSENPDCFTKLSRKKAKQLFPKKPK